MSDKKERPDYLTEQDDGALDVALRRAIKINGANVFALRMREPSVEDQLLMDAVKGGDANKEMTFFANLCEVTVADIKLLKLHDYKRLQVALGFLTE